MNMMNDPRLRTDSYAKIFLYNTHETVACVPRHTIRMKDRVRPDKLREAVEQALLRFPQEVSAAVTEGLRLSVSVLIPSL